MVSKPQIKSQGLDASWYVDPSVYSKERERIFRPNWWLMGPVSEVANPGDYFCDRICGWPLFVLRGSDGKLRAFLNVCRHRGASLLPQGAGHRVETIRCPYHGWLYDEFGALLSAPRFGEGLDNELDKIALSQIDVHVWNGLVFVRFSADQGLEFEDWLGEAATLVETFPGPDELDYHGEFSVVGELNWKTYCDNTVEGYHLNQIHPRLGKALAGGDVSLYSVNDGRSVVFDISHASSSDASATRGEKGLWIYHFPGFQLVLGDRIFKAERLDSEHPNHVRSRNWAWYGELDIEARKDAFEWGKQIVKEDFGICADVTRNMRAGVFEPGPLSPQMENHVAKFQQMIRDLLLDPQ